MDGPVVHLVTGPGERERSEKRLNRRDETAIGPHGTIVPRRFTPFPLDAVVRIMPRDLSIHDGRTSHE